MSASPDDDLMDTLTDEERAAMADSDEDEESLRAIAGGDAGGDADDSGDADDDSGDAGDEPAGAASAPAAQPAEASGPAAVDDAADDPAPRRPYVAQLPPDIDARVAALDESEAEAQRRFDDGEIDSTEFRAQMRAIGNDRMALAAARTKAEVAYEMAQQAAQQQWQDAQRALMRAASKNDGIDYAKDANRLKELDGFVRMLGSDPSNEGRSMAWFLNEAHRRVLALNGRSAGAAPAKPQTQAKPTRRNSIEPPASLANVPGADGPGDVAGEFGDIDALEGDDLEDALARMTPAQREKYARGVA